MEARQVILNAYTSAIYGDRIANVYDGIYRPTDATDRINTLAELSSDGRVYQSSGSAPEEFRYH